jgi:hypothetical protein
MARLSDYTFTPRDFGQLFVGLFRRLRHADLLDWIGIVLLGAFTVGLHTYTALGYDDIFFWVFAAWIFYFDLDARVSIGCALAGLITIPLLLFLGDLGYAFGETGSEEVAVWVYFFLVIGVVKQVWDSIQDSREQHDHISSSEEEIEAPVYRTPRLAPAPAIRTFQTHAPRTATPSPRSTAVPRTARVISPPLPQPTALIRKAPAPRARTPVIVGDGVVAVRRRRPRSL